MKYYLRHDKVAESQKKLKAKNFQKKLPKGMTGVGWEDKIFYK